MNSCVHCYTLDGATSAAPFILDGMSLCPRHTMQVWSQTMGEAAPESIPEDEAEVVPGGDDIQWVDLKGTDV